MNSLLAWHGTKIDGTTQHLKVKEIIGVKTLLSGNIVLCENALHGSIRAIDILQHSEGLWFKRTLHEGTILQQSDKIGSSERTVVAEADATQVVLDWAFWCANRAVHIHAVKALQHAGISKKAERLASLETITDMKSARAAQDIIYEVADSIDAAAAYTAADAAYSTSDTMHASVYVEDALTEAENMINTSPNASIYIAAYASCATCATYAAAAAGHAANASPNASIYIAAYASCATCATYAAHAISNTACVIADTDEMNFLNAELEHRLLALMGLPETEVTK